MKKSMPVCLAFMLVVVCVSGSNPFVRRVKFPEDKLNDFIAKLTNQKCLWLDPLSGSFKKVNVYWRRVVGCREYYCNSYGMIETQKVKISGEECA